MKKKTQEHEWTINIVSYSFGIFLRAILLTSTLPIFTTSWTVRKKSHYVYELLLHNDVYSVY